MPNQSLSLLLRYVRRLAQAPGGGPTAPPERPDLCLALNRVSSALYLLACKYVAGRYEGNRRPRGPVRGWRPPSR